MLDMVHNVLKKQNTKAQITELEFMCRFAKKLNFLYKLRRRHLLDVRSVTADLHADSVVHLQKIDTIRHTNNVTPTTEVFQEQHRKTIQAIISSETTE